MGPVLIVEDSPSDIRQAQSVLTQLGVEKVESKTSVAAAIEYLLDVSEQKQTAPSLMVLDLAFLHESGFEVLRHWKSDPVLKQIEVVVWTQMGELEKEMCRFFGLTHVVSKWAGEKELHKAIQEILEKRGTKTKSV